MIQEIEIRKVTKSVLLGFKKQKNRLEKLIENDPKKKILLHRLKRVGKCNYCLKPLESGEEFVRVGKNNYHAECFNIVFHDVPDDFNEEELIFIYGTIPVYLGEVK